MTFGRTLMIRSLRVFVGAFKDLLVPIMNDVEKYGLKRRHLNKHRRLLGRFHRHVIDTKPYQGEVTQGIRNGLIAIGKACLGSWMRTEYPGTTIWRKGRVDIGSPKEDFRKLLQTYGCSVLATARGCSDLSFFKENRS